MAYSRGLGYATNFTTKLCALRDGLAIIRYRGLFPIIIEMDSMYTIHAIKEYDKNVSSFISSLIKSNRFLLNLLGNPSIKHIYKKN